MGGILGDSAGVDVELTIKRDIELTINLASIRSAVELKFHEVLVYDGCFGGIINSAFE